MRRGTVSGGDAEDTPEGLLIAAHSAEISAEL
jgi:hypothetical protein